MEAMTHVCNGPTKFRIYRDPGRGPTLWSLGPGETGVYSDREGAEDAAALIGGAKVIEVCASPEFRGQYRPCGGREAVLREVEDRQPKPGDIHVGHAPGRINSIADRYMNRKRD